MIMNDIIAKILFKIGIKPKLTSFIGGDMSYGYGKMNGNIGIWQFQLPFGYVENKCRRGKWKLN